MTYIHTHINLMLTYNVYTYSNISFNSASSKPSTQTYVVSRRALHNSLALYRLELYTTPSLCIA